MVDDGIDKLLETTRNCGGGGGGKGDAGFEIVGSLRCKGAEYCTGRWLGDLVVGVTDPVGGRGSLCSSLISGDNVVGGDAEIYGDDVGDLIGPDLISCSMLVLFAGL